MRPPRTICCDTLSLVSSVDISAHDDWDRHWNAFGDAVAGNPATAYRGRLILKLLGPVAVGESVLEIGCGQGQLSLRLASLYPGATITGIDASVEGIRHATEAASAQGLSAHFARCDLMSPNEPPTELRERATVAICSEVLEHVDDPVVLLQNAARYLAPGCRLLVTVPSGPRSAFDRHIGHRRHFTVSRLRRVLETAGFEQVTVQRAGFPFFDLYRLIVLLRGRRLIIDVERKDERSLDAGASGTALRIFDRAFRYNLDSFPLGWQLLALAHYAGGSNW